MDGTARSNTLLAAGVLASLGLAACSSGVDGEVPAADAGSEVDAPRLVEEKPDAGDDAEAGLDSDVVDSGEVVQEASVDADADVKEKEEADADADTPPDGPTGPNVCGDGWRDLVNEECDDGVATGSALERACTDACTVIDRLASADPVARERRLGIGRHPVAGGEHGQAAAMVELVGEAGDEARVVVETFSPVGVRLVSVFRDGAVLDADPVVAALGDGRYALAYTDLVVDGDGLGVALVRVSSDGSNAVSVGAANATTEFSQRSPDIVWTGSEIVVGWEDESTIPRRVCTRRFSDTFVALEEDQCNPVGGSASRISLSVMQGQLVRAWRLDGAAVTSHVVSLPGGAWISNEIDAPAYDETIALTGLDAAAMLAVYSDGIGQLWAALIASNGTEIGEPIVLNEGVSPRYRPTLATTADGVQTS